jgi:hypothetical protein
LFHTFTTDRATVRVLGDTSAAAAPFEATVVQLEGKRLLLRCTTAIPAATPVRIDVDGALLLGEVVCSGSAPDEVTLSVAVQQAIPCVSSIVKLVQGIFGNPSVAPSARNELAVASGR